MDPWLSPTLVRKECFGLSPMTKTLIRTKRKSESTTDGYPKTRLTFQGLRILNSSSLWELWPTREFIPPHIFTPRQYFLCWRVIPHVFRQDTEPSHKAKTTQALMRDNVHDYVLPEIWYFSSENLNPDFGDHATFVVFLVVMYNFVVTSGLLDAI